MPTDLLERRTAPDDQSASIVFPLTVLAMLLLVVFLSAVALNWMELSFGPDGNIEAILS
jgi:hypothetical protein